MDASEPENSDSAYCHGAGTLRCPGTLMRLAAFSLYLGFAPAAWSAGRISSSSYWKNHVRQALALWALLGLIAIVLFAWVLVASFLMVYQREWLDGRATELWILSFGRKCLIAWAVFWLYGLWRCLRGSAQEVPLLAFLARRRFMIWPGMACLTLFFSALVLTPLVTWRANALVVSNPDQGRTFILYDDQGRFPRPLFSLAAYRFSAASVRRWGNGSAVLLPLTRENLDLALARGTMVFVGSHGTAEGLLLHDGYYRPDRVPQFDNDRLEYVYLAGCDSGAQREGWVNALAPAAVKTFDRLTPTLEHLWWLWVEGPRILAGLRG